MLGWPWGHRWLWSFSSSSTCGTNRGKRTQGAHGALEWLSFRFGPPLCSSPQQHLADSPSSTEGIASCFSSGTFGKLASDSASEHAHHLHQVYSSYWAKKSSICLSSSFSQSCQFLKRPKALAISAFFLLFFGAGLTNDSSVLPLSWLSVFMQCSNSLGTVFRPRRGSAAYRDQSPHQLHRCRSRRGWDCWLGGGRM